MKLTSPLIFRFLALCVGLCFAFPALAQDPAESLEDSCEDSLHTNSCSALERCCEQAPLRALILTIARCTADPDTSPKTCEALPQMPLPKSVLSCVFHLGAAQDTHQNQPHDGFFEASRSGHQPIPNAPHPDVPDDRVLSATLPSLQTPTFVFVVLPTITLKTPLLSGYHMLPETPG